MVQMILRRYLIGILLIAGLLPACTEREFSDGNGFEGTDMDSIRINIQIKSSTVLSRTPVIDPGDDDENGNGKQHVTYVHLYMFQLNNDKYTLVYDSPVDWTQNLPTSDMGEELKEGTHAIPTDRFNADVPYYFVVVGLDASSGYPGYEGSENEGQLAGNSADAYWNSIKGLMDKEESYSCNLDKSPSFPVIKGETMKEIENGAINPIPRSELFAGGTYVENIKNGAITIVANRRVAGIKAYFKGVPKTIGEDRVCYLALGTGPLDTYRCYSRYNHCLPLLPPESPGDEQEYSDYYNESDSYIWDNYPIIVPINNDETAGEKCIGRGRTGGSGVVLTPLPDEELIDKSYTEGLSVMGYLPPVAFPAAETGSNSTLMLYLMNEYYEVVSSKKIVQNSKVQLPASREGTGIIPEEGEYDSRYHYPIMANHFYRIGTPDNPVDLDASEAEIVVSIDEFQDEYYGGHLGDNEGEGVNMDTSWGNHNAGNLEGKSK